MQINSKLSKFAAVAAILAVALPAVALAAEAGAAMGTNLNIPITKVKPPMARNYGGAVTAVSGNVVSFKSGTSTYSVDTTGVKLVRRYGATMTVADFQVNDQIQVRGTLNSSSITASLVRDMSLQARSGTFSGTVQSLGSDGSFVLASRERGNQTIRTTGAIIKKNGSTATLSDLAVGQSVKVMGVWDRVNSDVTAKYVWITIKMASMNFAGTLAAKSSTSLTVTGAVTGGTSTTYTVDISKARLIRKLGGKSNINEFNVGDSLQIWSKGVSGATSLTASLVRDNSITAKSVKGMMQTNKDGSGNTNAQQ